MLIESLIKRAEGTFVKLDNDIYHFFTHVKGDARHVCEVTDEDHIQTFLAVKEGYRIAKSPKRAEKAEAAQAGAEAPGGKSAKATNASDGAGAAAGDPATTK